MHIQELIDKTTPVCPLYVISPKGTFGSGKSSIPHGLKQLEEEPVQIFWPEKFPETRSGLTPVATYLPRFNLVMIGEYKTQCGGCDILQKAEIQLLLEELWKTGCHILYEGAIVTHTKATYPEFHAEMNKKYPERKRIGIWPFLYIHPLESVRRVMGRESKRSEGCGVKLLKILEKHNSIIGWFPYYMSLPDNEPFWVNTHMGMEYVLRKVMNYIGLE